MFNRPVRTVQTQAPPGLAAVRTQSRKLQSADGDEILVGIRIGLIERAPADFVYKNGTRAQTRRVRPRKLFHTSARGCAVAQRSGQ